MKNRLIFIVIFLTPLFSNGQAFAPMSGASPKSFSLLPDNLGFLENSVNLFTGQVAFSLPVMGLQGIGNLSYSLALSYNSSNVKYLSSVWIWRHLPVPLDLAGVWICHV